MSVILSGLLGMTLPPFTGDTGVTSIVSCPIGGMILVLASITNVQSLSTRSLIARLSAVTVFTVPTAVIVSALRLLPPFTGDTGPAATDSCAARVRPADTNSAIAIIIAVRFITNLRVRFTILGFTTAGGPLGPDRS